MTALEEWLPTFWWVKSWMKGEETEIMPMALREEVSKVACFVFVSLSLAR